MDKQASYVRNFSKVANKEILPQDYVGLSLAHAVWQEIPFCTCMQFSLSFNYPDVLREF